LLRLAWWWSASGRAHDANVQARLDRNADEFTVRLSDRLRAYEDFLTGLAGFFEIAAPVRNAEWEGYMSRMDPLERYPGTEVVGFITHVPVEQIAAHESAMRADGVAGYSVLYRGAAHTARAPVTLAQSRNPSVRRMLGTDVMEILSRREALERARDTGRIAVTVPVDLLTDRATNPGIGQVAYMPVYAAGADTSTPAGRTAGLAGWAFVAYHLDKLLGATWGAPVKGLEASIWDRAASSDKPIHRLRGNEQDRGAVIARTVRQVAFAGRSIEIEFTAGPAFVAAADGMARQLTLALGILATLGLVAFLAGTARRRDWALAAAARMTRELSTRNSELQAIQDHSPMGIFRVDATGTQVRFNARCLEVLGITGSEMSMATWLAQSDPADAVRVSAAWEDTVRTQADLSIEFRWIRDDGRRSWVSLQATAIPSMEGVTGFVGTLEDCTARKEDALSLERSREFVREVLASIPQPMFVKDASHRWLMVNDAFAKLVGRRPEELVGATDADVFPPDWVARSYLQDDEALAADHAIQREDSFIGVDGRDRWMLRTKRGVRLADGSTYVIGIVTDTTEMKNAALEANRSRAFVDAVVNSLPNPIFVKDEVGRFVLLNQAARQNFGTDAGEILGRAGNEILGSEVSAEYDEEDRRVFAGEGPLVVDEVRPGPDGQPVWWYKSKRVVALADGSRYLVGTMTDVSRLQEISASLKRNESRLSTVNAIASAMARSLPLDEVLRAAVNSLSLATDGVQARFLRLYHRHMLGTVHASANGIGSDMDSEVVDLRLCPEYLEAIRNEEILVIDDLASDARFSTMRDGLLMMLPGAVIDVPIRCNDTLTGVLRIETEQPRAWSAHEKQIVAEAAEYIEVAWLQSQAAKERRAAEQALKDSETRLRLVNLVSKRVTEGDHVYNVLERAVDELQRGFPKARVTYWSSDEAHTLTAICCSAPTGSDNLVGERIDPRLDTTWAESLRQNRPVAFADLNAQMKSDSTSERTLASGAKSLLVVPLIRSGQLLGAISLSEPEPRIWLDNEVAMMGEISDALAVAVLSANVEQERRIAETALRESEARFRGLTELSSDWFWEQDASFRFTLVSKGAEGHEAAAPEEMIGKTRWEAGDRHPRRPTAVWVGSGCSRRAHA
jgi:PAS domain S-box-containing protein